MKKRGLQFLLLSIVITLTSCTITFTKEIDDEGKIPEPFVPEYYSGYGDSFSTEGLSSFVLDMGNDLTEQGQDLDESNIIPYINDESHAIKEIKEAKNVALGVDGLKVGHINVDYKYNGILDISFNSGFFFQYATIYASPRTALIMGEKETKEVIDSPVALSVNDSKFVKIDSSFDTIEDITITKCSYRLPVSRDHIKLVVFGQRLIIHQIVLYQDI